MALKAPQTLMFFNGFSSAQAIKHWQKIMALYIYIYIKWMGLSIQVL
jgi:hypothetical protein